MNNYKIISAQSNWKMKNNSEMNDDSDKVQW